MTSWTRPAGSLAASRSKRLQQGRRRLSSIGDDPRGINLAAIAAVEPALAIVHTGGPRGGDFGRTGVGQFFGLGLARRLAIHLRVVIIGHGFLIGVADPVHTGRLGPDRGRTARRLKFLGRDQGLGRRTAAKKRQQESKPENRFQHAAKSPWRAPGWGSGGDSPPFYPHERVMTSRPVRSALVPSD